jgi:hypothetical protein
VVHIVGGASRVVVSEEEMNRILSIGNILYIRPRSTAEGRIYQNMALVKGMPEII